MNNDIFHLFPEKTADSFSIFPSQTEHSPVSLSLSPLYLPYFMLYYRVTHTIYYDYNFSVCWAQTESGQSALVFTADMNQQVVSETTQTGTVVYTLQASPSGATDPVKGDESGLSNVTSTSLRFFIRGTEVFVVNEATGEVTLSQPLDREVCELL